VNERNLIDLLINQTARFSSRVALRFKRDHLYQNITWNELQSHVIKISAFLRQFGIKKGDRVALLSENRPEWVFADLAVLSLGAVVVPIYPTSSPKEMEYIVTNSECRILFLSTDIQFQRLRSTLPGLNSIQLTVIFDSVDSAEKNIDSLERLLNSVKLDQSVKTQFESDVSHVKLDDLATIIYTSGTTGPPKGVMLSHRNFLINCYDSNKALPVNENDVFLSFLPLSHVFERMGGYYLALLSGSTIAYAENMTTVPENLLEVKPTITCAVPRFFEKMYSQIQSQIEEKGGFTKQIFNWAVQVGRKSNQFKYQNCSLPFGLNLQRFLAYQLIYSKIYQKMGGKLRCFISGGAPLSKELAEFFYSVGILILEGYGLTETSPVISVNRLDRFKFGSVGLPLSHVETRITDDDEIVVKGPSIMVGYYKDEVATKEAVQEGWFHTGDLGKLDSDGFLYITGRKKDIIVTSGGKNISPQNIENTLLADPLFSQVVLIGDQHNYMTALIVPNFEQVKLILKAKAIPLEGSPRDLVREQAVHDLFRARIGERTKDMASYEQIKYFALLPSEFSQEKGEVTLTLKIRRKTVAQHYAEIINRMYRETEKENEGRNRIFFVN